MGLTMDARHRPERFRLPDGSRSVGSPWVWRAFLFMSFIALGLCITFAVGRELFYATAWGVITAGWLGIAMWLWRKHLSATSQPERGGRARR